MEPFDTQVQQDSNSVISDPVGFPAASSAPKKKSKMWIIVLILFVIAIAVITFIVFKGSRQTTDDTQSLSPTSLPVTDDNSSPTPEATPTPAAVSKGSLKVQVLNGTGVAGEAAFLQTKLKNLGYTNVDTGNATETTTTTTVAFGSSVSQDVITEITALLKKTYTNVVTSSTAPDGFDIQVTVGSRSGAATSATTAPSASASPTATPAQ